MKKIENRKLTRKNWKYKNRNVCYC